MGLGRWGFVVMCVLGTVASTAAQQGQECGTDGLDRINFYRSQHGAGPLQTDKTLMDRAKANAAQLAKDNCAQKGGQPSSVWMCQGKACATCPSAVDRMYWLFNDNYKFGSDRPWTDNQATFKWWGAGSNMLWIGAKKGACGWAAGGNCLIISCMYDTGNINNDQAFKDNVKPKPAGSGTAGQQPNNKQPGQPQQQGGNQPQQQGPNQPQQGPNQPRPGQPGGQQPMNNMNQPGQEQQFRIDSGPIPELPDCRGWAAQGLCARGFKITIAGFARDMSEWCPISCGGNNNFPGTPPFQPQNNQQQQQQGQQGQGQGPNMNGQDPNQFNQFNEFNRQQPNNNPPNGQQQGGLQQPPFFDNNGNPFPQQPGGSQNFRVDSGPAPELPECGNWARQGLCARGNMITVGSDTKDIADWCLVSCGGFGNNNFPGGPQQPFNQQGNFMPFDQQQNRGPVDQMPSQQGGPQFDPRTGQPIDQRPNQGPPNFQPQQQQGGGQGPQGDNQQQRGGNPQQQGGNQQQQGDNQPQQGGNQQSQQGGNEQQQQGGQPQQQRF